MHQHSTPIEPQFICGDPPGPAYNLEWLAAYRDFAAMSESKHRGRWALIEIVPTRQNAHWRSTRVRRDFDLEIACRQTADGKQAVYARHAQRAAKNGRTETARVRSAA